MIDINERLVEYIRSLRKATVHAEQLERVVDGMQLSYEEFAAAIIELEQSAILGEVRSAGRNPRPPHVAYRYRIRNAPFQERIIYMGCSRNGSRNRTRGLTSCGLLP